VSSNDPQPTPPASPEGAPAPTATSYPSAPAFGTPPGGTYPDPAAAGTPVAPYPAADQPGAYQVTGQPGVYPGPGQPGGPYAGGPHPGGGYPGGAYPGPAVGTPGGGKGFAITALVLAIVALVLSWVPFINNGAALLAVAGVVFGVIALVGALRKGRPGKGMAIAAIVMSVVAFVVVIVTQVAYSRAIDDVFDQIDENVQQLEDADAAAGDPAGAAPVEDPAGAEQGDADDIVVVDVAFGQTSYDPTMWWYVAIVENPNPEHVFPFAGFTAEAVGADGTILDSSPDYVDLLPGTTALSGTFLAVGSGTVDHVEIRGPQASEAVREPELGSFSVSEVAATTDEYSTTVGGNVASAFEADQELVEVTVVAASPDGTVLGAEQTYVDRLPAGGQARFEVMFIEPLPGDTVYTAYPNL
jgi:hypothetical protein